MSWCWTSDVDLFRMRFRRHSEYTPFYVCGFPPNFKRVMSKILHIFEPWKCFTELFESHSVPV
jgi:hypothetical protein